MESKKSSQADLEVKKPLFLQAGLIISLTGALVAFEWESPVSLVPGLDPDKSVIWLEDKAEITRHEPPKPLPAPPSFTRIDIKDNDLVLPDYELPDAGISESDSMPFYTQVLTREIPDEPSVEDVDKIFKVVQSMPEFPGGMEAMQRYLKENLQYPQEDRSIGIQGTVYVFFIVEKDGTISNVSLARGIGGSCDQEALRVVSRMPRWVPGMQMTKPVRVQISLPISFRLMN